MADFSKQQQNRAARNAEKPSKLVISSVPLSLYAEGPDGKGVLCRFIFSGLGTLGTAVIGVDSLGGGKKCQLKLAVSEEASETSWTFDITGKSVQETLNMEVEQGTRLVLSVVEGTPAGVWLGFSWLPNSSEVGVVRE